MAADDAPVTPTDIASAINDLFARHSRIRFGSASAQVRSDHRNEMVHPTPNGLVRNRDAAFR
jgi:hypothetical protein